MKSSKRVRSPALLVLLLVALSGCEISLTRGALPEGATCWSIDGRALFPAPISEAARTRMEQKLADSRDQLASNPHDRAAAIWVGRRLGYLGRYREAVAVYSEALKQHPEDPYLLRHRGHRHISLRQLDHAIADLSLAAKRCRLEPDTIEPDGIPTPGRPPHSSLHFNVHYHLGLALFLVGDFAAAERAWLDCLAVTDDDESLVAVSHWLWCVRMRTNNRAGAAAVAAAIRPDMDIVENISYHRLCLLYAGRIQRDSLTMREGSSGAALAFGLAHHALVTGSVQQAQVELSGLSVQPGWAAFGVIAAEAESARRGWLGR